MDMLPPQLNLDSDPRIDGGRMLLAFTGWMDGGDVSTGTVRRLVDGLGAKPVGDIAPEDFFIYNFPGSMEIASLFRPAIKYDNGVIQTFEPPVNRFYCHEGRKLAFFLGKEPHLKWQPFADCIFEVARQLAVSRLIFIGSFGGGVPHTREPRLYTSASSPDLVAAMKKLGLRPSDYEGPSSFAGMLMHQAPRHNLEMVSLVAEIPAYLQGTNPRSIEAVMRRLAAMLDLHVDMAQLRGESDEWETQVTEAVEKDADLAKHIRGLEEQYDEELIG